MADVAYIRPTNAVPDLDRGSHRGAWSPILMGAATAIGFQFLFTVLGLAIGVTAAGAVDASDTQNLTAAEAAKGISMAAGAWWLVSGTVAILLGGVVVGRGCGWNAACEIRLRAVAMWGVVAIFGFLVIWSGAGAATNAASPLAALAAGTVDSRAVRDATSALRTTTDNPDSVDRAPLLPRPSESEMRVAAEDAREAAATAAWWSVFGLLIGLGAAVAGSMIGMKWCLQKARDGREVPV